MATATKTAKTTSTAPAEPDTADEPVRVQHPALDGDVQGEIDHRTADPAGTPGRFRKVFHLSGLGWARADHPVHLANAGEVLGDALRRGLHPKGDVHLVDTAEHDERRSQHTALTYEVDVVPAVVDDDAESTLTPHDVAMAAAERKEG